MSLRLATLVDGALIESPGAERDVPWWSVGKIALAAAALALVRDGRLALDETLVGRPFTLRQLLQHRAGLTTYGGPNYAAAVAGGAEPWPTSELLARTDAGRLRYPPGEGWAYSNIGYLYVRRRIEEGAGEPLAAALARLVLRPLGLMRARLAESRGDLAAVDWVGDGGAAPYHPGWVYHGLLVGPLGEAALLVDRLLAGSLLPAELLAAMRRPHPVGKRIPGRPWSEAGYGFGLMIGRDSRGLPILGHTGAGPGSVIAAYHRPGGASAACAMPGSDEGAVEAAAFAALAA
jgi:CubicO group peptidase (beta-lactamase class C family)